jgi:hypothetical protein
MPLALGKTSSLSSPRPLLARPIAEDSNGATMSLEDLDDEQLSAIFKEISTQSDRGVAITASAFLEYILQWLIEAAWPPISKHTRERLFEGSNAPLGTFSAKIELGFAMDLYGSSARADLDRIRSIRNRFAHSMHPIDFTDDEISKNVASFQIGRKAEITASDKRAENRQRFVGVAQWLMLNFVMTKHSLPLLSRDPKIP